jgi:hypothetical protein
LPVLSSRNYNHWAPNTSKYPGVEVMVSNVSTSNPIIQGLVLESTEEAIGVYRRVGYFSRSLNVFEAYAKGKPDAATPLTDKWPARFKYSKEEGFTIAII